MFPSPTNSSTLSESACSVLDKPTRSPDCRPETAPSLLQDGSNRFAPGRGAFRVRAGLADDRAFFSDCFFPTGFLGRFVFLSRDAFFARFAVAVFDFVRVLLLLFFSEGMEAVYHRISPRPERRRNQRFFQQPLRVSS